MIVPGSSNPLLLCQIPTEFIGASSEFGATDHVISVPPGTLPGDLLILAHVTNNALPSLPPGFTLIAQWSESSAHVYVAYKIASGESVITANQSGSGSISTLLAYSGLSATVPFDSVSDVSHLTGTSCTANAVTTTQADDLVLHVWGISNASAVMVPPELTVRGSATGTTANRLVVADEAAMSIGVTAVRTVIIETSAAMAAFTIAFKK